MNFVYYVLAPLGLITILVLIFNLIRADVKFENNRLTDKLAKKSSKSDNDNDYLEFVGELWDYLKKYNYGSEYIDRKWDPFKVRHTCYSFAYKELEQLRIKSFLNEKLQNSISELLSYFEYWNSGNIISSMWNIKPKFKKKSEFNKSRDRIKKVIKSIASEIK